MRSIQFFVQQLSHHSLKLLRQAGWKPKLIAQPCSTSRINVLMFNKNANPVQDALKDNKNELDCVIEPSFYFLKNLLILLKYNFNIYMGCEDSQVENWAQKMDEKEFKQRFLARFSTYTIDRKIGDSDWFDFWIHKIYNRQLIRFKEIGGENQATRKHEPANQPTEKLKKLVLAAGGDDSLSDDQKKIMQEEIYDYFEKKVQPDIRAYNAKKMQQVRNGDDWRIETDNAQNEEQIGWLCKDCGFGGNGQKCILCGRNAGQNRQEVEVCHSHYSQLKFGFVCIKCGKKMGSKQFKAYACQGCYGSGCIKCK